MRNVKTKQLVKRSTTRKPFLLGRRIRPNGNHPERISTATAPSGSSRARLNLSSSKAITKIGPPSTAHPVENLPGSVEASLGHLIQRGGLELNERVKELLRLAKEQGYLTYEDITEAFPESVASADDICEVHKTLANHDIEIIEQAEVDQLKQPEPEEAEDKGHLDLLDDPVRMYLSQMGKVPLLDREKEVAICKRIEEAENEVKRIIYGFGFTAKEHMALAEKLISEPPKERFDRVVLDTKMSTREQHLKALRQLVKTVRKLDAKVDGSFSKCQTASSKNVRYRAMNELRKLDRKLQASFQLFQYKPKVIEEMILVAENIQDKFKLSLHA